MMKLKRIKYLVIEPLDDIGRDFKTVYKTSNKEVAKNAKARFDKVYRKVHKIIVVKI